MSDPVKRVEESPRVKIAREKVKEAKRRVTVAESDLKSAKDWLVETERRLAAIELVVMESDYYEPEPAYDRT